MRYDRISAFLKDNRAALGYTFILGLLLLFPLIMAPIFKRVFTDSILVDNNAEWLLPLLLLMGGISVFSAVVTWLQKNCVLRLSNKIELAGTASYMWRLFNAPPDLFYRKDSFVLLSGAGASSLIARTLTVDMLSLLPAGISVIFYFLMMFRMDAVLSLIVAALATLNLLAGKLQSLLADAVARPSGERGGLRELALQDERTGSRGLRSIETFKATASEIYFFQQMISSKIRIINARGRNDEAEASSPFGNLPELCFLNLLLLISALRIMNRELSIGSYLEFQAYAAAFFYPMSRVLSAPALFGRLEKRLGDLYRELESETGGGEKTQWAKAPALLGEKGKKLRGRIEFKDVCFSYPGCPPLLEGFNLSLEPGRRAAIVGKSGCGKSAVLKLLQGLYTPESGEVTIDGAAPACIDGETFRASVGCANQKLSFFTASVRDNITLWDTEVSDGAVYRAVREAGLHSFVATLEGGYDHILEENGRILSGGQQQRLEIARALIYDPSVLILDEVNSAIDPGMVAEIEANLQKRGCAILQATQILPAIIDYDEILLLEKGRVAARGAHRELLAASPWYASLYREGATGPRAGVQ
jgi:ABC-type bacteriocin/lantibiotic exporter with double-glycine peptidase domain